MSEQDKDSRGFNFGEQDPLATSPGSTAPQKSGGAPAPSGTEDGGWEWTKQYGKRDSKKSTDTGPIALPTDTKNADLASMYVSPDKVKSAHSAKITYGGVPEEDRPGGWGKRIAIGLLVLSLFALGASYFLEVGTGVTDINGVEKRERLIVYAVNAMLGGQRADPNIEAFANTKTKIKIVHAATADYMRKTGGFPRDVQQMVDLKLITDAEAKDGWGNTFITVISSQKVISNGLDGKPDTSDDISLGTGAMQIPSLYTKYDLVDKKETF